MLQELYWQRVQRFALPTEEETIRYANDFTRAHSWYKHLDWTEPTEFLFFISPSTGEWSYTIPSKYQSEKEWFNQEQVEDGSEVLTDKNHYSYFLPTEVAEKGKVMLTAFIHKSFESSENENFKVKHAEMKTLLLNKLQEILEFVKISFKN